MRTARQLLADAHTVAVVGASRVPQKAAHWVPKMLQEQGWHVIPVNPHVHQLFGERAYARLSDVPVHVDIVNVFRPAEEVPELVREATAIGAGSVWLQLGITSEEGRRLAREAGLDYVENTCIGTVRALAQMVVGGATPHPKVYRGLVPRLDGVSAQDAPRAPAGRAPVAARR
jgi:predicted CoA-binding protein